MSAAGWSLEFQYLVHQWLHGPPNTHWTKWLAHAIMVAPALVEPFTCDYCGWDRPLNYVVAYNTDEICRYCDECTLKLRYR